MGVWRRARLYLFRKKARSVILFLILSVMGIFLLAGVAVRMGADKAAEEVRRNMTSGLVLERIFALNSDDLYTSWYDEDGLEVVDAKAKLFSETVMEEVLKIKGVIGYYVQWSGWDLYTGLELHPGYNTANRDGKEYIKAEGTPKNKKEEEWYNDFVKSCKLGSQIMGFHTVIEGKWEPSFLNGALTIVEGRNIETADEKKVVISEEVAQKNNLSVGDTITGRNYEPITSELYGEEIVFEIVGIFRVNFKQPYSDLTFENEMLENIAFTDRYMDDWVFHEYHMHYSGKIPGYRIGEAKKEIDSARIFVEDPKLLASIREQILSMENVDWQYYTLEMDDTDYKIAAKPLLLIKNLFTVFLAVLFVGMLAVLSLVLSMWIKSRRHEVGILASVGVPKRKILMQFLLECCIIFAAASLFAGILYRPVTRTVADVTANIFSPSGEKEDYKMTYDMSTGTFEVHREISEPVDFSYGITWMTVGWIFFIMLVVVMLAALRSAAQIVSQKPKDILL